MKLLLGVAVVVTLLSGSAAYAQYDHNQGNNSVQNQSPGQDQGRANPSDNQDHHNNDNRGSDREGRHHHRHQVCNWYHHHRHCHWSWG
jgi:hypothetical protein